MYRALDGSTHDVSEVLGSGGASFAGERKAAAAFAETSLPLLENLDLRLAGRGDDYDDVGGMQSWRLGAEYRPTDLLTLRTSWSAGERAPSLLALHSSEVQDHPYIECDPGTEDPPRTCTGINPRQVTRETLGNPDLDPSGAERFAIGAEVRKRPWFASVEWYRLSRSDVPGHNSADWAMRNLVICEREDQTDCIDRTRGRITIRDRYANVVDNELTGFNTRFGGGFRTSWGVAGMRGMWRRVTSTELRIAGEERRVAIPRERPAPRFPRPARGPERRLDRQLPLGLREPAALRVVRFLDRPRPGAGLVRTPGDRGRTVHDRGVQPHRRATLGKHRQPQQRGRADGSGLGAHLLRHREHAVLKGGKAPAGPSIQGAGPAGDARTSSPPPGGGAGRPREDDVARVRPVPPAWAMRYANGRSTVEPVVRRSSMARCTSGASRSG